MPIAERWVINEAKALGDISLSVAREKGLFEAAVGSGSLRHHHANQVANSGNDVRREDTQDMAVAQVTISRIARNRELGFSKLTRGKLTFADQRILHGLRQAAEEVGVEEDVSISW
jgi:hypothetical protein